MSRATPHQLDAFLREHRPRWVDLTLPTIAENLALEEALAQSADDAGPCPLLRFWEAPEHAVVLGASGRIHDDVHGEAVRADGAALGRRSSGGGTVVVGPGALNVAVVLPLGAAAELTTVEGAQGLVLNRFAVALRGLGRAVSVAGSGDLVVAGRKVAGSAQRRLRRVVLIHVTILYAFELGRIGRYLKPPRKQPAYREGRSHDEFVANLEVTRGDLLGALGRAWALDGSGPSEEIVPHALLKRLLDVQFRDQAWVERF